MTLSKFGQGLCALGLTVLFASTASATNPGTVASQGAPGQGGMRAPGDALAVVTVPVLSPSGIGVSVAATCHGTIFYTNYSSAFLHSMNASGGHIATVPTADASGAPVYLDEIAWDSGRQILWGASLGYPIYIWRVNPTTGLCYAPFVGDNTGYNLTDGLAYDSSDDSIWHSSDVSCTIYHFSSAGASLGSLTPQGSGGGSLCSISGVYVGVGDLLYLGQDGLGTIVKVRKSTGAYLGSFGTPGGRDEGLECDAVSFAPKTALWSKDAYNNQATAMEVEAGTCLCGGATSVEETNWGTIKAQHME